MKKVTTFIAFMCFANAFLTAQNRPIKFGISINTNYSDHYFYSNDATLKATFDKLYSGKFSYSVGAFVEKEMAHRGRLRIGANAMNTGHQIVRDNLTWGSQNNNGTWNPFSADPNDPTKIRFVYNFINLELPVDYQYFINKKRSFFLSLGVSPMLNLYNYGTTETYFSNKNTTTDHYELKDEPIKKISLALQFGMGYAVNLTQRLTLDIQPRVQSFITPLLSSSAKSGILPYNIGLQTGLTF